MNTDKKVKRRMNNPARSLMAPYEAAMSDPPPDRFQGRGVTFQKSIELAERRVWVAELLFKGKTYPEIAEIIGVKSTHTVWKDVQHVMDLWRDRQVENIHAFMLVELQKTLIMEAEAWAQWEESKRDKEKINITKSIVTAEMGDDEEVPTEDGYSLRTTMKQLTLEGRLGDPRYLAIIDKCIDRRAKLLGLYAPERLAVSGSDGQEDDHIGTARTTLYSKLISPTSGNGAKAASGEADR